MNWAAFGPLSTSVVSEVAIDAEQFSSGRTSGIELVMGHNAEALDGVSRLLDVPANWMTHQPSTTDALMQAAFGIRSGQVMASMADWPGVTLPIARAAASLGRITPQWVTPQDGFMTPEVIADALTDDTTAVVLSLVDFRTGYRADLGAIRDVIGEDRLLIVDAIQGFGVIDADYSAADVIAANGYKWVRAGRGTGFAAFSPQAREQLDPVLSMTAGLADGPMFDTIGRPADSAQAFQVGPADPLASARLAAGVQDILNVGIDAIEAEVGRLTAHVIATADRFNLDVATPRGAAQRAGIVSVVPRNDGAAMLAASLLNDGVTATVRSGAVRIAVHAGTDDTTMRMFDDAVAAFAQHAG